MTNSEWIEKLRAAAAMCQSQDDELDYKYWAAVAFDMLPKAVAYIDQQATALDEAEALIKKNADQINALLAQVVALKELAEEERAKYNLSWKDCAHRAPDTYCEKTHNYCTLEDCPLLEEQKTEARRQLAKEHPGAFR